jgi:hypothetical protein
MIEQEDQTSDAAARFVTSLRRLDRSKLLTLRQAAGKPLGAGLASFDIFNGLWRPLRRKRRVGRGPCWLVATLFPWNSKSGGAGSLGAAMRAFAARRANFDQAKRRFSLLLASSGPTADLRLLETVRLLAEEDLPLDWVRLLRDLSEWYAPGRPVQRTWANDFLGIR